MFLTIKLCTYIQLYLCRGIRLSQQVLAQLIGTAEYTDCIPAECSGYDTKQSVGEASVMLELWWVRSTLSLPSLPGPLGS